MPVLAILLPLLAAAPEVPLASSEPVVVTGHAWAPFISPMGEPFRSRGPDDDTLVKWFRQADDDQDGMLTMQEMQADAHRFFNTLDTNRDGEIDPDELVRYEWEVAPEIQVMSKKRRSAQEARRHGSKPASGLWGKSDGKWDENPQGGARYALLNIPEPVAAADADFDRGITASEFQQAAIVRFQLLDSSGSGILPLAQLLNLRSAGPLPARFPLSDGTPVDPRYGNPLPPRN